jgi:hypothetical protein
MLDSLSSLVSAIEDIFSYPNVLMYCCLLNLHQWTWRNVAKDLNLQQLRCEILKSHPSNYSSYRPHCRPGLRPLAYCNCGFESHRGVAVYSVSVVCCQVAVCASGRSLFQRSPTDCCAPECDREASIMNRPWPTGGCWAMENVTGRNNKLLLTNSNLLIQRPVTQYSIFVLEMVSLRSKYFRCVSICYLSCSLFIEGARARAHTHTYIHTYAHQRTVATHWISAAWNNVRRHPHLHNKTATPMLQNVADTSSPFPNCNLAQTSDMRYSTPAAPNGIDIRLFHCKVDCLFQYLVYDRNVRYKSNENF